MTRQLPHDITAEQNTLGAMMLSEHVIGDVVRVLGTGDFPGSSRQSMFYRAPHRTIYVVIVDQYGRGEPTDPTVIGDRLGKDGTLARVGGLPYLHTLIESVPIVGNAVKYADIVRELAESREEIMLGARITQAAETGQHEVVTQLAEELVVLRRRTVDSDDGPVELDDLLAAADADTYNWIVQDFLERRDRFFVTGTEGCGKSTFLRQVGIQVASGVHPLTGALITPIRVLQVDLENSEDQCRRELRPLRLAAGDRYQRGNYHLRVRAEGIDLTDQPDRDWLFRLAESIGPDLLTIGPVYKMANGDPIEEKSAKPVAVTLDRLRVQMDCALLIEGHPAKAGNGAKRPIEPYGWSGWLRWPEFGYHLDKDGQLTPWRGQRDASRDIPGALRRGGEWPWTPLTRQRDILWSRIRARCSAAGEQLAERDLAVMFGVSKSSIHRAIEEHSAEWDSFGGAA